MREDLKKGNSRPHLFPGPPHHLGVGVIVEAGLGIIVIAGCLIVLVGGDIRNSWGLTRGGGHTTPCFVKGTSHHPPVGWGYSRYWL